MLQRHAGFAKIETLTVLFLIAFVLVVALFISDFNKAPALDTLDNIGSAATEINKKVADIQNSQKAPLIHRQDLFSEAYGDIPFNERLFNDARVELTNSNAINDSPQLSYNMQGKVLSISTENGLRIKLLGLQPTVKDRELEYYYAPTVLSKIRTSYPTFADIRAGDSISIDETHDFSRNYPESYVSIYISSIN